MNCFDCDRPASGLCHFCSRGVCKDHFSESLYIQHLMLRDSVKYLAMPTEKVLKCSFCRPIQELVQIEVPTK